MRSFFYIYLLYIYQEFKKLVIMRKKLYYIVELELENVDDEIQETTGMKSVRVYEIVDNEPYQLFDMEIHITDNVEEAIQEYLEGEEFEEEFNDKTIELTEL